MKCPHCKKEIPQQEIDRKSFIYVFIMNSLVPMLIIIYLFRWTGFEKAGLIAMAITGIFYAIYSGLYVTDKVNGRLLIYSYWLNR